MKTELLDKEETEVVDHENCHIVVFNDDVNPFNLVIETFIEVLGHNSQQAEQLALIIHTKGQARVKSGTFETLQPLAEKLIAACLDATIE